MKRIILAILVVILLVSCDSTATGITRTRGKIKVPSVTNIGMGAGGSRSTFEVMRVVRARFLGLRYVYSNFLEENPHFSGIVEIKFTIAASGEVISISVSSSTTDYAEFDNAVAKKIKRWEWKKIKSGNTIVKIPFTFYK